MRLVYLFPFSLVVVLVILFAINLGQDDGETFTSPLVGKAAPEFSVPMLDVSGPATDDEVLNNSVFARYEVSIVNFWASWCTPCRAEHPEISALKKKLGDDLNLGLLGVNYKDDPDKAQAFLSELGNPFTSIGRDTNGRVGILWGITGVPETFIVNRNGLIVAKIAGPLTAQEIARVVPLIEKANAVAQN